MKVLKKQGLTLFLIVALVVTLTLGIVFTLPARPTSANAEEIVYTGTETVSTEEELKNAVKNAETTPTKIVLKNDIEMDSITSKENKRFFELTVNREQVIEIDLAGHILSTAPMSAKTKPVIYNYGTLSIVDSSNNYSGAVVSNGYIESKNGGYYWDASNNVIENYGALTVDANLRMNCPSTASWGTGSPKYVGGGTNVQSNISKIYLIYNHFEAPKSEELIYPTSLTINGGNFDLAFSNYYAGTQYDTHMPPMEHFFYIGSTDLTINGGTFRNTATRSDTTPFHPQYQGGFLANIQAVTSIGDYENLLKDVLHMDIKITGGDFGDKNLLNSKNAFVYVDEFKQKHNGDEYEISISGGKFPMDLSVYTDAQHMMKENDDGTYSVVTIDDDYIKEYAAAKLMLDDGESTVSGYFGSFEGAWSAAQTLAQMGQSVIIQLLKNADFKSLVFEHATQNSSIILDLNGHTLNVTQDGTSNAHIRVTNIGGAAGPATVATTFVVRDSAGQDGVLNLVYLKNADSNGGVYLSDELRFVLESGTITRTGGGFSYGLGLGAYRKAIFYYDSKGSEYYDAVTLKGGNILSQLNGDDQGTLIAMEVDGETDTTLGPDKQDFIKFDLANYLDSPEKGCRFSWNVSAMLSEGFKCAEDPNTHIFHVSAVGNDKYSVGMDSFTSLSAAIEAAGTDDSKTILMIAPDEEVTDAVELDGITLDLNVYQKFTLKVTGGITLKNGAKIVNGAIAGTVTVEGPASFENFELQGELNVKAGAELNITEGTYNGNVTVAEGANLSISGGYFLGSQVSAIEQYLAKYHGAFKSLKETYDNATLYPVQVAPNMAAQAWYTPFVEGGYIINNATDWNNFAIYVSSGLDNFNGKLIKLGQSINFNEPTQGIALYGATATEPNFLPAGTNANRFAGSFDGQNKIMSGIYAQELNVGLFGATAYGPKVRVMNVTLENSTFLMGNGLLDSYNSNATWAGGAIIGEGHLDAGNGDEQWSGNITLSGVTVGLGEGYSNLGTYLGGLVGHSWGSVYLDGLKIKNQTTIKTAFKVGGVVGYLDGVFHIKKADIEQGKDPDEDNGLILESEKAGILVGHAHNGTNIVENCTILEHQRSLFTSLYTYDGSEGDITIKGAQTDLDIYRVVGGSRESGNTTIEITGEVTEEGVSKGSIKTQQAEDYLTFTDGEGNEFKPEKNEDGGYDVQSDLRVTVIVSDIKAEAIYGEELTVTSFTLKTVDGITIPTPEDLILTVKLKESNYNVGKQVALITSISLGGAAAENYTLAVTGQQAFMEVEVTVMPATLYVGVDENGEVTYDGFVNGDDASVLSGELVLERNGNVVTPSGLSSENYNIVFVSRTLTVDETGAGTNLTALWVVLAVVGAAAVVATGLYFGLRRKKQ